MFTFNFEKLDAWQEAVQFADLIYKFTKGFPEHERFGLTNQIRRAAVSYVEQPPPAPRSRLTAVFSFNLHLSFFSHLSRTNS